MIRAAFRGFLAVLLTVFYLPITEAFAPPTGGATAARAACCAPRACCTSEHACTSGGACATKSPRIHGGSAEPGAPVPLLRAGRCHPEAARVGTTPTLDPGVLLAFESPVGGALIGGSGGLAPLLPSSRPTSPQVPPPRV